MKKISISQAWDGAEKCLKCPVRNIALFANLQQADFNLLHEPILDFDLVSGDTLYTEKNATKFVYTIRSGMVKLVRYLPNGNYRIVRLLRQGDLVGIEALNSPFYLHHAIALQNTKVCRIPVKEIERLNNDTSNIYKQLTVSWQKVQSDADVWLTELTIGSSKQRVANLLLYLANHSTEDSFYLPTREDIGTLLAITTETASRIIAEFKRLGYLQTKRQSAQIEESKLAYILNIQNYS